MPRAKVSNELVNTADAFAITDEVYHSLFGLTDSDRDIVCKHDRNTRLPPPDQDLCSNCRRLSYAYWHPFVAKWRGTEYRDMPIPNFQLKLDQMLQYTIAMNDLDETGFVPLLGWYPREEVVERLLGMVHGDMDVVTAHCVRKPAPVVIHKWDTQVSPYISSQLRRFLTDLGRATDNSNTPYLWDMGEVHRKLAMDFISAFSDPELDMTESGQEVKAYAGTMWMAHAIRAEGGFENVVLSKFFGFEEFSRWFRWASEEGWKRGIPNTNLLEINTNDVVSPLVLRFAGLDFSGTV
ncbi:hypothetical protein BDN72DRAFT_947404 [Pluteus cervinus]|uniref:Uncharacterized protein n=1 Tax=Pluteus cervinus TaxID=181527 RepID=A0ACD3AUQ5_9AGAR|nr:hypothetical protein BDN72DRAFT_947404 [Pluteus cervinus]